MSASTKPLRRALLVLGIFLLAGLSATGGYFARYGWKTPVQALEEETSNNNGSAQSAGDPEEEDRVLTVKVVKPKLNRAQLVNSVTQPAYVQAYHKANLMTRVAGVVKTVHKNIGDPVKKDEILIEIDVPDLVEDLGHKEALIRLAEEDVKAASANIEAVRAAAKEARVLIDERKADVDRSLSKKRFHASALKRVKRLVDQRAVEDSLVDEREKNVEAADADYKSSLASVETARANADEFAAKLLQAKVEEKVKQARVDVARAEARKAKALVDYAKVRAPFDGIVVSRKVDPGAFIQNASTGHPDPLMTVVRTDSVTLVVWVPEREAALVNDKTEAILKLDALGNQEILTKVSRSSQWLDPDKSRDMRVEIDHPNADGRLKVGMYGSMKLILQRFDRAMLLPASTVFVRRGQTYILEVIDGKAKLIKVRVQQEDGIRLKLVKLVEKDGVETVQELTGNEQIVRSGQGEIRDGQELKTTMIEW